MPLWPPVPTVWKWRFTTTRSTHGAVSYTHLDVYKRQAVGKMHKPVLLKRGLCNTIEEWIMSAEYIMAGGRCV